jgi:thiosulfate reductase cytochrome b subunit
VVIFVLLPLMILTGLTMSQGMDAILPWLVDIFGGRQSARTIHFITAGLIVLFVFVHVAMVLLASPVKKIVLKSPRSPPPLRRACCANPTRAIHLCAG